MATEVAQQLAISIVDDDQSVREAAMDLVNSLGFSAEAFPSTEAFLRSDALVGTSWLIADVQMPGMSGLELRCRLAASDNAIPTILITACPDDRVQAHALKAGVVGYLTGVDELIVCIDAALAHRKASSNNGWRRVRLQNEGGARTRPSFKS